MKTNGVFHTTSPGEGLIGMMMDLTVTDEPSGAQEPAADVTLAVRNSGFKITGGAPPAGR